MYDPNRFAEKYQLALETAIKEKPENGLCGCEIEFNLLDSNLRPLLTVGSGPNKQSFVDYLRADCIFPFGQIYSQLEVFHWMIEWATRAYYTPRGAVYESRLLEGTLLNALYIASKRFDEEIYSWHGNLLVDTEVGYDSIPGSWNLAKRRYLERCVDIYGRSLATAGTHANLSLPDTMLAWDFMHLSPTKRGNTQFDQYKSQFYITATRLMRAFAALFIATGASTPLTADTRNDEKIFKLTQIDSIRNLTFPNPTSIDLADLYRSYEEYLAKSYDLVKRKIRFGNNNWTPVRARSFAEPVERLIDVTSEQLNALYARGLYALGEGGSQEEVATQIEIQNLIARIDLPMSRVEVRTDDGGQDIVTELANLTLKHLLMLKFYADPEFARAFRYDQEDVDRARRNEERAARKGLRAEIENPFTGKVISMRDFLAWTLNEIRPLALALELWNDLSPLQEMSTGGPNTSEKIRQYLCSEIAECDEVPLDLLKNMMSQKNQRVRLEIEEITRNVADLKEDQRKLEEYIQHARESVHPDPELPIRFRARTENSVEIAYPDKTSEILALAQALIRIPTVTVGARERLEEVRRAATMIYDYVRNRGLGVRYYDKYKYPALLIGFPEKMHASTMLMGHYDVVEPEPDDSQCEAIIEGEYLHGRGSADMKTVVATYLVWMKDRLHSGSPYPDVNLLLVGNEENGETEPMGSPQLLRLLQDDENYQPGLCIAGERTGERGNELFGEICIQNRGLMRVVISARGARGHSGTMKRQVDLVDRMIDIKGEIEAIGERCLTLNSQENWYSQIRFPFLHVGNPGIFNITADNLRLGLEVRTIPQDKLIKFYEELKAYCDNHELELDLQVMEEGIACNPANPQLLKLINAYREVAGKEPVLGKKLPGTSARFAPGGEGIVWGQAGIGPHSITERHYIPSIMPYYKILDAFAIQTTEDL
ncbi:MAG: M20/M25/M40 family metallo-hydrolase [Anaerolineales bacterium]|nr:MAG: M20/M25/M40 family metallo-hydrolase [Anaerolineales bacterium]